MFVGILLLFFLKELRVRFLRLLSLYKPKKERDIMASFLSLKEHSGDKWMSILISLIVLLCALFVILSNNNYTDAHQKWAFGVVGYIVGHWLNRSRD
jgi:hypothetical protein